MDLTNDEEVRDGRPITIDYVFADRPSGEDPNFPFPQLISSDPLVAYHGTSCTSEAMIDATGFRPGRSRFSKEELTSLAMVFEELRWHGISGGSYGVLRAFSLGHDFQEGREKPTFFAESANRAALFASKDFAGGEIARAVRLSFAELRLYLEDLAVREIHQENVQRDIDYMRTRGALPPLCFTTVR